MVGPIIFIGPIIIGSISLYNYTQKPPIICTKVNAGCGIKVAGKVQ